MQKHLIGFGKSKVKRSKTYPCASSWARRGAPSKHASCAGGLHMHARDVWSSSGPRGGVGWESLGPGRAPASETSTIRLVRDQGHVLRRGRWRSACGPQIITMKIAIRDTTRSSNSSSNTGSVKCLHSNQLSIARTRACSQIRPSFTPPFICLLHFCLVA